MNDLLRCETLVTFKPNVFCEQKQHFDSIFNLGIDTYFKKSGRFWRYRDNGFDKKSNYYFTKNLVNIRLDPEIAPFLERNGFGL